MRKILLSISTLFALIATNNLKAQCDLQFANLVISPAAAPNPLPGGKCEYVFNASFDITTNSGFKYLFFHSWLLADYPNPAIFDCSGSTPAVNPGTNIQLGTAVDDLGKSFLDIGFLNLNSVTFPTGTPVNVTANFAATYPHDNLVILTKPSNSPGLTAIITRTSSGILHFDVTNIRIVINGVCGAPIIVKTDIWGSNQNAQDPKAQCYICGLSQSFNDPSLALVPLCGSPNRHYSFSITTGQSIATTYNYFVYMSDPLNVDPDFLINSGSVVLSTSGTATYSSGVLTITQMPYCCISPWSEWDMRLDVTSPSFSNTVSTGDLSVACAALPVNLKSFTAVRNNSYINLKWETAQEENSKGFDVQRKLSNGAWATIGFAETKAINGNSSSPLSYDFTDYNNTKGITQYRLRQLDISGKQTYSLIRSVRGDGQKGKTIVFPNPSSDGKVTVVFEDKDASRDVSLMDMNGRVMKQWKNVMNNTLQIENLVSGFYTLRIINSETGVQLVEKIVVKNR